LAGRAGREVDGALALAAEAPRGEAPAVARLEQLGLFAAELAASSGAQPLALDS